MIDSDWSPTQELEAEVARLHDVIAACDGEIDELFGELLESRALSLSRLHRIEQLEAVVEWIAHFDDAHMETARTLHYDMRGKAREALEQEQTP